MVDAFDVKVLKDPLALCEGLLLFCLAVQNVRHPPFCRPRDNVLDTGGAALQGTALVFLGMVEYLRRLLQLRATNIFCRLDPVSHCI